MAKAINQIEMNKKTPAEVQAESLAELLSLIAENRQAITTSLEIIQELHSAGLLDMMKDLLKNRAKLGVIAIDQLNKPSIHRTIKNGINTIQLLGEIDPDKMKSVLNAANKGLEQMGESDEKMSKWALIKSLGDPNIQSTLSTMIDFLKGMGKELSKKNRIH